MKLVHGGLVLMLCVLMSEVVSAQRVIRIESEPSCSKCRISVESVTTLVGLEFTGPPTFVRRGPGGRYYAIDREGLVRIFGKDGKFVRQIGRRGGGPGEYEVLRNVVIAPDSTVHLLDIPLGRRSIYTAEGDFRSSSPLQVIGGIGMDAVILPNNELVMNIGLSPTTKNTFVLKGVAATGSTTRFLDDAARAVPWRSKWLQRRALSVRSNGDLLVVRPYAFAVDVYGQRGNGKLLSLVKGAPWNPGTEPTVQPSDGVLDTPLAPSLVNAWEDSDGLLWLYMTIPHVRWQPGPKASELPKLSKDQLDAVRRRPRLESIVEAVDPASGKVLARYRADGPLGASLGNGYFAMPLTDEEATVVSRLRLTR